MRISDWSSDVCSSDLATMADQERIDFSRVSFLIVEPNRMMGQMVRDVLMMLEAQYIDRARDLASAVNILRLGRIDVLITEWALGTDGNTRSEEHTSELQSLMRISYAVFCLKKKTNKIKHNTTNTTTQY